MPTKEIHIEQAKHNRQFWTSFNIDSTYFLDWIVVGIFYEGIHWIEAFFATRSLHSVKHKERLDRMFNSPQMKILYKDFQILKDESENARYRCYRYKSDDIKNELIPLIDKIKNYIQSTI